mmetsp:Transcript_23018/g.25698  ORF Transcript_23018/g.25698 Transcript_23018/m.25698 type:complete len:256 (-) Transcript_23018:200-967(-)
MDNRAELQRYGRYIQNMMPPLIANYMSSNLDTIPKVILHVLFLLTISNFVLIINSMSVSFITFVAASLLALQTFLVIMITNNNQINFAPRSLEPTEFIVGLSLGICIGGGILSFFVSATFSRAHSFCKDATVQAAVDACGKIKINRLSSVHWWSSIIFLLDVLLAFLIALGREEITHTQQQQYNSIDSRVANVSNLAAEQYNTGQPQFEYNKSPTSCPQDSQPQQHQPNNQEGYGDFPGDFIHPSNSGGAKVMSI